VNLGDLDGELALGELKLEGLAEAGGSGLGDKLVGFVAHQGVASPHNSIGVEGHQMATQGGGAIARLPQLHLYPLHQAALELLKVKLLLLHPLVEAHPQQALTQTMQIALGIEQVVCNQGFELGDSLVMGCDYIG
jgi:hypothetical protein